MNYNSAHFQTFHYHYSDHLRLSVCSSVCVNGFYLNSIFLMAESFAAKFGMLVPHHELEFYAKRFDCSLQGQGQGHSEGSKPQE